MFKRIMVFAALLVLSLGILMPALAVGNGDVIIGQELVLRIRFAAGGMTIQERADAVTERLNDLLGSTPFSPNDVKVTQQNKEWVVMVGNNLIITADKRTADFNKATPEQLANMWAANLRKVIPRAKSNVQ